MARRNLGFPNTLTVLTEYPTREDAPSVSWLQQRAKELQDRFPLLHASMVDEKTPKPYWQERAYWSSNDIVRSDVVDVDVPEGMRRGALLELEWQRMANEDFDTKPAWQIVRYTSATQSYIAVSGLHDLFDGIGILRLSQAVLMDSVAELPFEVVMPPIEDKLDIRPSYTFLLPVIWQALIVPKLPRPIRSFFEERRAWPGSLNHASTTSCPAAVSVFDLEADSLTQLRTKGKQHGTTLTAVLEIAITTAIWHVHGNDYLRSDVPANQRSATDPYCTGCYVASYTSTRTLSPTMVFWGLVSSVPYGRKQNPAALQEARMRVGMLAYVPDGPRDDPGPTGWESFLRESMNSNTPYDASVELSNLGFVELPTNAVDLVWGAPKSPRGPCYDVLAVGHQRGLRLVFTWREGAGTTRQEEQALERTLRLILHRLIGGGVDTQLGRLVQADQQ